MSIEQPTEKQVEGAWNIRSRLIGPQKAFMHMHNCAEDTASYCNTAERYMMPCNWICAWPQRGGSDMQTENQSSTPLTFSPLMLWKSLHQHSIMDS
jgi:hypothetical protein